MNWVIPALLAGSHTASSIYCDAITQIVMPCWSTGRVTLVGVVRGFVSLRAGQGVSMAMAGAYVLAEELARTPSAIPAALTRYEARIRPLVETRQQSGRRMADWFMPGDPVRLASRDLLTRFAVWPGVRWFMKRTLVAGGKLA